MAMTQAEKYYTPEELVARWKDRVTKGTLANWRASKKRRGPPFAKIGGRVLYPVASVHEWEEMNLHAANENEQSGN